MTEMNFPQYECMDARDRATQDAVAEVLYSWIGG